MEEQQNQTPTPTPSAPPSQPQQQPQQQHPHEDKISQNKLMAILAYLGILIIVPFLVSPQEKYVKFHIKQGTVLIIIWLIIWVVAIVDIPFDFISPLLSLGNVVLMIIGIVNAFTGKEKELPLVGHFAQKINY